MPRQRPNAPISLNTPPTLCSRPLPRRPENGTLSIGMPLGGTSRFSMPWVVPSQLTIQPRARSLSATARPGITWPPVPAAITTRRRGSASGSRSGAVTRALRT